MHLPKYHETFTPILETLKNGEGMQRKKLKFHIRDEYYSDLSEGGKTLLSRINGAIERLKSGKFLYHPARGIVQITQKGKEAIARGKFVLGDLTNDPDYISHREARKAQKELNDNDEEENTELPEDLIKKGYEGIKGDTKGKLFDMLDNINPYFFEDVILELFEKMGYGIPIKTPKSKDGGIDGIIHEDQLGLEKIYIQAKCYNKDNKIREKDIRDFIGAMSGDTNKGVFVTTSSFDNKAEEKAKKSGKTIVLIDGNKLADLMYQHGVGVQVRDTYEVKKVDEDFFEGN